MTTTLEQKREARTVTDSKFYVECVRRLAGGLSNTSKQDDQLIDVLDRLKKTTEEFYADVEDLKRYRNLISMGLDWKTLAASEYEKQKEINLKTIPETEARVIELRKIALRHGQEASRHIAKVQELRRLEEKLAAYISDDDGV